MKFKLGAEDRERLGAPEVLEFDTGRLMVSEARRIQKATGLNAATMAEGLEAFDADAVAAVVWLCLLRAGVELEFEAVDFNLGEFEFVGEPAPGKAPEDPTVSS